MRMFVYRCMACNAGIVISYPLETLKVRIQTKENIGLLAGIETPIIFSSFTNGMRFQIFSMLKSYSLIFALLCSGAFNGFVEAPYHSIKLRRQMGRKLYPGGGHIIFIRELIGTFIHFFLFNYHVPNVFAYRLLYGGITAVLAMSVVYPSDRLFINYKTRNMRVIDSLRENKLWEGYRYSMLRSFVGYSITMYLQSHINSIEN